MKKNTRNTDRQKILESLAISGISEEGRVGTVSLNIEKLKRWRREIEKGEPRNGLISKEVEGNPVF